MTKTDFSLNVSKTSTYTLVPNHALPKTNLTTNNFNNHLILKHKNIEDWYQNGFYIITVQLKLQNYNKAHIWDSLYLLLSAGGIRNETYLAYVAHFIYKENYSYVLAFVRHEHITLFQQQFNLHNLLWYTIYLILHLKHIY